MPTTRDEILRAALQLPESDRLVIANQLLETLPDNFPGLSSDAPDFTTELQRRSGDWNGAIPWEQLKGEVRQTE